MSFDVDWSAVHLPAAVESCTLGNERKTERRGREAISVSAVNN